MTGFYLDTLLVGVGAMIFMDLFALAQRHFFWCASAGLRHGWTVDLPLQTRALRLIEYGAPDTGTVDDFAEHLGFGARYLSRLFADHVDTSPIQTAQTHRIGRAKCLLDENAFPMKEIAFKADFGSVRRFNAALSKFYGRPPSSIRRPK